MFPSCSMYSSGEWRFRYPLVCDSCDTYRLICDGLWFLRLLKDNYWKMGGWGGWGRTLECEDLPLSPFPPSLSPSNRTWIWVDIKSSVTKIKLPVFLSIFSTGKPTYIRTINGLIIQTLPHTFTMAIPKLRFRNFQIRYNWYKNSYYRHRQRANLKNEVMQLWRGSIKNKNLFDCLEFSGQQPLVNTDCSQIKEN